MATATPVVAPDRQAVQGPLAAVSGTIRRYVLREGLAWVGLVVIVWFWLDLLFDFGSFKLFAVDWVLALPKAVRAGLLASLVALVVAVAAWLLGRRLWVDFSPAALALVLEKRFPEVLGDRLITAVDLADIDRAEAQGYSRAMIEDTVREAGERVAKVPVADAFDWRRLRRLTAWVVGLALLPFLLFGIAYSAVRKTSPVEDYLPRSRDVAVTWARRNLLLQDVLWPRKAYLEVLDFPESGELRIGRDAPAPRLRMRARRWVVADSNAVGGWRPMVWTDLTPSLLGGDVPVEPTDLLDPTRKLAVAAVASAIAAPNIVPAPAKPTANQLWTLDRIEAALEDSTTKQLLLDQHAERYAPLMAMFDTLSLRAAEPGMRGSLRRLEVPEKIVVRYWGAQTASRMELNRGPGWEYTGALSDLKESVRFQARAADYFTDTRSVTLVPPPALQQLRRTEYRPAYLYHRPPTGEPLALRGLKQKLVDVVNLNGAISRITVPAGTDIVLDGSLDKELHSVLLKSRGNAAPPASLQLSEDRQGFIHRLNNIVDTQDFDLEFIDADDVRSTRHVIVEAARDLPPQVNVELDGLRKMKEGHYLVTPIAMLPMTGKVVDGLAGQLGGLDRVDYSLSVQRLEAATIVANQASWLAGGLLPLAAGTPDNLWTHAIATADVARGLAAAAPTTAPPAIPSETFAQMQKDRAARDVDLATLKVRLDAEPATPNLIKDFSLNPRFEYLDLRDRLPSLKAKDEYDVQSRYRLKLTVVATDNNIETGPGVAANKEPPFTILVVSEAELLIQIDSDEEKLREKTEAAVSRLRETKQKLDKIMEDLAAATVEQLPAYAARSQETVDATAKSRDDVQEVSGEFAHLLRELKLNRVRSDLVVEVEGKIVMPLESALKGEFVRAEETLDAFRKELEAARKPSPAASKLAKDRLDQLIEKLTDIMTAMGGVTTVNKLIIQLREVETGQNEKIGARLRQLKKEQIEKRTRELEKLEGDDK